MIYKINFNCPKCKHPCNENPTELYNELVDCNDKAEARRIFQAYKPCRHMQIVSITETDY